MEDWEYKESETAKSTVLEDVYYETVEDTRCLSQDTYDTTLPGPRRRGSDRQVSLAGPNRRSIHYHLSNAEGCGPALVPPTARRSSRRTSQEAQSNKEQGREVKHVSRRG